MRPPEIVVIVTEALEGPAVPRWGSLLAEAAEVRPLRVVVDLTHCPSLDAAAVVHLLQAHRTLMRMDGRLLLRRPPEKVLRILRLARVDHVLEVESLAVPA